MNDASAPSPAETYHAYLGPGLFIPCARRVLEAASPRPGETAVDVACGTGILTHRLAVGLGTAGRVTGVDVSPDMLAVARSQPAADGATIDWREGSADSLPVADGAADLLTCQQGFQFFPHRFAAAREMHRALDADGRAVIAVWRSLEHHAVFRSLMEAEAEHLGVPIEPLATPFSCGDAEALRDTFREAGFRRVQVDEASFTAEFPQPDRFIALTVMAAAAVLPESIPDDPADRAALVEAVGRGSADTVSRFSNGDRLRFPMHAWIVTAER